MEYKVSVIVPVYKVEKYLKQCLDSIINQTLKEIEIILIDDNSPDNCGEICDEYSKKDSRVKVIHKQNEGLGLTRNLGMEISKGKYIGFVDSDDYIKKDMYEKLYNIAEKYNAEVVYSSDFFRVNNAGKEIKIQKKNVVEREYCDEEVVNELLPNIISAPPNYKQDEVIGVSVWKALYKNGVLKEHNIRFHSERVYISEDAIFQIELLVHIKKAVVIPYMGYYYRKNQQSLSMKYQSNRFEMVKILYKKQLELVNDMPNKAVLIERIQRIFIANMRLCAIQEVLSKQKIKTILRNIKIINNDEISKKVLSEYSINKLPIKKRIIAMLQKYNINIFLYLLIKLNL